MNDLSDFLIWAYPGRVWSLPTSGGVDDIKWLDGDAPVDLADRLGAFDPDAPVIPQSVTPAQGLMALYALKSITEDDIMDVISTVQDPTLRYQAQITYKKATTWQRTSVTMQTLAGLLSLTEPDLDELFTQAATYANL